MQTHPIDKESFLSTEKSWDLDSLVDNLPTSPVPTCLILIEPRESKVGLLEERGFWIINFWQKVLEAFPLIRGQRFNWSGLIFFSPEFTSNQMIEVFSNLLRTSIHSQLKSKAIFSIVKNDSTEKLGEIEQMELQLNKINYWNENLYYSYYEDGTEKLLNVIKET